MALTKLKSSNISADAVTANQLAPGAVTVADIPDTVTNSIATKLPLAGGAMTGAITTNSTFDGRDVSVDGTKLDGIEAGATADQTKADIDALNINADLLDGQHGTYYTGYADTAVANLVDTAPATLDTLNELAAALGDDPNFATTVTNSIATKLPLAGGTLTGNVNLGDNVSANFGASYDLQIYHDGNDSYINDTYGTGNLYIASNQLIINNSLNNENMARFAEDGAVTLYNNGAAKLATTATGIDVTGTVVADGLTVDGNVGIGTSSPNSKTHIVGAANAIALRVTNGAVDGNNADLVHIEPSNGAYYGKHLRIQSGRSDFSDSLLFLNTTTGMNGTNGSYMRVQNNSGVDIFRIKGDGNVGIGTSSPTSKLFVADPGTTLPTGITSGTGFSVGRADGLIGLSIGYLASNQSSYLQAKNFTNTDMLPISLNPLGGNVGIGTDSPSQKFTVYNGNILLDGPSGSDPKIEFHQPTNTGEGGVIVYNDADEVFTIASRMGTYGDINFATGMNDGDPTDLSYSKMFISGNGNVGIGTSSPAYRFEVSGSAGDIAKFSGNATNSMRIYLGSGYQIFQCYNGTHTNQFGYGASGQFYVQTAATTRMTINSSGIDVTGTVTSDGLNIDGHIIPGTTDAYDIGSASNVIRNIYTGDLHLSNESKSEGNKVDGTKGNWTMQEGEEHLYIINNKSGKKYRFALEEIQ